MSHRIILVRHGSIGPDLRHHLVGSTDAPLSEKGRQQSRRLRGLLRDLAPTKFYCSPLRRARETSREALEPFPAEMVTDPNLREIDFGQWEGMSFDQVSTLDAPAVRHWGSGSLDFCFPNGEKVAAFVERIMTVARRMADDDAEAVAAFTHGGVIRFLICHYLGLALNRGHVLFDVRYGAVTTIDLFNGNGVLTGLNLVDSGKE